MNTSETQWKPVPGFEGLYDVSDDGQVKSHQGTHIRILKPKFNRFTGYTYYILGYGRRSRNMKPRTVSGHRLVAEAFLPNPDNLPEINHKNEIKTDNRVENLEWCTSLYNSEYSKSKRYKPVELYTVDGEHLCTFTSERAAAELLGVGKANVTQALKYGRSCAGFFIKYGKEE